MQVESLELVLARYQAAVERKRELDPNFVVMAQCYAGEAANGGLEEALHRMKAYKEIGQVDWVQFTAPRSIDEIKQARQAVDGPFSVMQGFMPSFLPNKELLALGVNAAWGAVPTHMVTEAALYDFVQDFMARDRAAVDDFRAHNKDNPYVNGKLRVGGGEAAKQRELEERYLSPDTLEKYEKSVGRTPGQRIT